MRNTFFSKAVSLLLAVFLIMGILPMSVFATEAGIAKLSENEQITTYQSFESTLAPGITQTINSGYAADGKLINYYIAIADINRSDVGIHTSYKDAQCTVGGMAKMTDQVVSLENLHSNPEDAANYIPHYAIVAGVNGDGYNTGSGVPSGVHIANGVVGFNKPKPASKKDPWFAIFEDGTALCGANAADWDKAVADHGPAKEAIGGFQLVRKDGRDIAFGTEEAGSNYLDNSRYPRSFVGVTTDNKVVFMVADGNGSGGSAGTDYEESLEIMDEAGCTYILCLDGGGSATYVSRPVGSNDVQVTSKPSDGSERAVSNGLVMYTTTPPSDSFDKAEISAENYYVTPGSEVKVSAVGISPAGTAAQIPENIVWSATNGSIVNGVFVSDGTLGDAVITMTLDGKTVGSTTIHVVNPTKITLNRSKLLVPYGETITLEYTATYGLHTVKTQKDDVIFTLADNSIGTINGDKFTAATGNIETTITAKLVADESVSHTIAIKLGKGSEVIMNFETGDPAANLDNWGLADQADGKHIHTVLSVVTPETGMVHGGNQALAFNYKMDEGIHGTEFWAGNGLRWLGESIELKDATGIGFWLYVPEDAVQLGMFTQVFTHGADGEMNGRVLYESSEYTDDDLGYSGWRYIYMPLNSGTYYIEDNADKIGQSFNGSAFKYKANKFIGFYAVNIDAWKDDLTNFAGDFTFYIDDITVDYSDAVADRELPIFSDLTYAVPGMSDANTLNGQTVNSHVISFAGKVTDDMTKDNATGLDASTAVVYIDGKAVNCVFEDGMISVDDYNLTDGTHTIRMGICDNQGNYREIRGQITVNSGDNEKSVLVVPQNPELEYMLNGSVYWIDIKADAVETVKKITVKLDLDSMNNWELDQMTVLSGFDCEWEFATANDKAENIVTVTLTRNGYLSAKGTETVVSLPIRVWDYVASDDHKHANAVEAWKCNYVCAPALSVDVETEYGVVEYIDGTSHTFSSPDVRTYCVSYTYGVYLKDHCSDFYKAHSFHVHSAAAVADKTATCTEDGYTGRTWCATCNSPVAWGTSVKATGHTFVINDDVLKCACGERFNGVHTDGKTYTDGVANAGWIGESYYVDGVALTGVQLVDGYYYDFGEDGVCANKVKYTGKFYNESANGYSYAISGEKKYGWYLVDDSWNYFSSTNFLAKTGTYTFKSGACAGITYVFDETGNLTDGVWHTREDGNIQYFYGPNCYKWTNNMLQEIDGKTYCFDKDGYLYRGAQIIIVGAFAQPYLYHFDDVTGELIKVYETETGLITIGGKSFYLKNGAPQYALQNVDGEYYFFGYNTDNLGVAQSGSFSLNKPLINGVLCTTGKYTFDKDFKMLAPEIRSEENGLALYIGGVKQSGIGMITIDGDRYYVNSRGVVATGKYMIYSVYNGCSDLENGYYDFGTDGKLIGKYVEPTPTYEFKVENGTLGYFVNGVRQSGLGMITVDGDRYYINTRGIVATGKYMIYTGYNGCSDLENGYYDFGTDGKLIGKYVEPAPTYEFKVENGTLGYFVNGVRQSGLGMITVDGDRYYINTRGIVATGKYMIYTGYNGCSDLENGYYDFGTDGKLIGKYVEPAPTYEFKVEDGTLGYFVNGVRQSSLGMITVDGDRYYINTRGIVATGKYMIYTGYNGCSDLENGYYDFGTDGKLIGKYAG